MLEIKIFLGGRRMEEFMIDTKKSKKDKENMGALSWKPSDKNSSRIEELTTPSTMKRSRGYGQACIN